eukprot:Selendium_serpulae@DN6211_c0_g2_i2.p1
MMPEFYHRSHLRAKFNTQAPYTLIHNLFKRFYYVFKNNLGYYRTTGHERAHCKLEKREHDIFKMKRTLCGNAAALPITIKYKWVSAKEESNVKCDEIPSLL